MSRTIKNSEQTSILTYAANLLLCGSLVAMAACSDGATGISVASETPDAGCTIESAPKSHSVYFVLDVSGSMRLFLEELSNELQSFVESFPEYDADGERIQLDFYVIAFVNDVKQFGGGRMTSVIALQDAFENAIEAGKDDFNLTVRSFNAEREENLMDAIGYISSLNSMSESHTVMIATDAPFRESPELLNEGIQVQNTYEGVMQLLRTLNAGVHAFTASDLDGLTRGYRKYEALTSLPGSSVHRLNSLTGASSKIRETLGLIARNASCQ